MQLSKESEMTGAEILTTIAAGPKVRRYSPDGTVVETRDPGLAPETGTVDEAVLAAWTADAATITPEQRRQIALRLRKALMAKETGGSPSLATTAALIDMLEA